MKAHILWTPWAATSEEGAELYREQALWLRQQFAETQEPCFSMHMLLLFGTPYAHMGFPKHEIPLFQRKEQALLATLRTIPGAQFHVLCSDEMKMCSSEMLGLLRQWGSPFMVHNWKQDAPCS